MHVRNAQVPLLVASQSKNLQHLIRIRSGAAPPTLRPRFHCLPCPVQKAGICTKRRVREERTVHKCKCVIIIIIDRELQVLRTANQLAFCRELLQHKFIIKRLAP